MKLHLNVQVADQSLELIVTDGSSVTRLSAEFVKGPLGYRRRHGGGRSQAIARAVGLRTYKGSGPLTVYDVTAGLGRDAFVLATLGCSVHLVERSPIIGALLLDGLARAANSGDPDLVAVVGSMQVTIGEAAQFLEALPEENLPEVIYLDPMFPVHSKDALNKIEMRIIREIVGPDEDADRLLKIALSKAKRRVVVKRPAAAPPLLGLTPSFLVQGKSNRYDVYLSGGYA